MGLFGKIFGGIMGQDKNNRPKEDIDFENQVRNDGYEHTGKRIADILNEKITSQDLARQFVLEELDAARQGNDFAQNFVKSSGFKSFEYIGAINKTRWEGDESELEHLQLFLRAFLIKISDIDLMVKLSTKVVDEIMQKWGLGKYDNNDSYTDDSDNELEKILAQLDYSEENVENIIKKYSDVTQSLITGLSGAGQKDKRNKFAEHMAIAALKENYKGTVYSCFVKHGDFFENLLPIPIVKFSDKAFEFLLILLNNYAQIGFSKSFKEYLKNNQKEVLELAHNNNKYAQFLMGFWYVFDEGEKNSLENRMKWYEKSALNGYLPAMFHTANFYDNAMENLPTDLKKSAYWYRAAALQGDFRCAYNLAVMYLQGDGVSYNKNQAILWLSYAWTFVNDDFEGEIETYAEKHNIELEYNPSMLNDIESNPVEAELNNLYTDKITSMNFNKNKRLVYVVEKKYNQPEGILAEINNDLGVFMTNNLINSVDYEDKLLVMAYGYARRLAAAGLFLQGVFNREGYNQAKKVFQSLQVKTGHTVKFQEDAFAQALEYIQSYDNRVTREFASLIIGIAENEETVSIYDSGQTINFERLFEIFSKSNDDEEIPF